MSATQQDTIYSDFKTSFTIHPIKKDLALNTNEMAVRSSIINIIKTNYYERKFRPRSGANITRFLFENLTPIVLEEIKANIATAIANQEPRAEVIDITVSSTVNNQVDVSITFSLINSLQIINIDMNVGLERVR